MTAAAGVMKRFATRPPRADPKMLNKLYKHVYRRVREEFEPLDRDCDVSVETWIDQSPYPAYRKKELWDQWNDFLVSGKLDEDFYEVQSFIKDETYPEYKHARAINSRHDVFKCMIGPIIKQIEKVVYAHPAFIKHIPVADRGRYIKEMLQANGVKFSATDFTSMEALFVPELMEVGMILYRYMTKNLPGFRKFMRRMKDALTGENYCKFKYFIVRVLCTRMSGEMNTSLDNGFSNWMFIDFICYLLKCDYLGCFEGDDGICRIIPRKGGRLPTPEDFARLGLLMKLEYHSKLSTASFCGLIFDEEDMLVISDPIWTISTFGWVNRQYMNTTRPGKLKALLRCKALSLAHQYPGCPIIAALASYALRVTNNVSNREMQSVLNKMHLDNYQRQKLSFLFGKDTLKLHAKFIEPPMRTRLLVEQVYGVVVQDQIRIEKYLFDKNDLAPIDCPELSKYIPTLWTLNYKVYGFESHLEINRVPGFRWPVAFKSGLIISSDKKRVKVAGKPIERNFTVSLDPTTVGYPIERDAIRRHGYDMPH